MQPKPLRRSIRVVTSQLASPAPVFGCVCETDSAGPAPYITKVSDFEITIGKYVPFAPRENYRQN